MPNIKSAAKRMELSKKSAMRNKSSKSALKTHVKKFDAAVALGDREMADSAYKTAVKAIDKASGRGLLHKNNAARKKSKLTTKLNSIAQ